MKCPYCNKEMVEGYMSVGKNDFRWTPKGQIAFPINNCVYDYEVLLKKTSFVKNKKVKVFLVVLFIFGMGLMIYVGEKFRLQLVGNYEKDIYKIQEGQHIRVKSSQYNYFEHGYFTGKIYAIDELPRLIGNTPYYTVRINLDDRPDKPLRLGSTGGVEILTGRNFIFKIIFDNLR